MPFWPPKEGDRPWRETGRLLRVDRDGHTTPVRTRGRIERIKAGLRALFVELAVPPTEGGASGMTPPTDWVGLPWDADVPDLLVPPRGLRSPPWDPEVPGERVAVGHGVPEADEPNWDAWVRLPWDGVGKNASRWYSDPSYAGVATDRHRWGLGWNQEWPRPAADRRLVVATAHTADGAEVRRWELGAGRVRSSLPLGDRLALTVARPGGAGDVLALDPDTGGLTVLLAADAVDITELGWPVVPRPVEADSYAAQVRAARSQLDLAQDGGSDLRAALDGDWPDTELEWTFRLTQRPGLVLRRRVRLFDELGRIDHPEDATMDLVETVGGGGVPPAEDAVDGILDL